MNPSRRLPTLIGTAMITLLVSALAACATWGDLPPDTIPSQQQSRSALDRLRLSAGVRVASGGVTGWQESITFAGRVRAAWR